MLLQSWLLVKKKTIKTSLLKQNPESWCEVKPRADLPIHGVILGTFLKKEKKVRRGGFFIVRFYSPLVNKRFSDSSVSGQLWFQMWNWLHKIKPETIPSASKGDTDRTDASRETPDKASDTTPPVRWSCGTSSRDVSSYATGEEVRARNPDWNGAWQQQMLRSHSD